MQSEKKVRNVGRQIGPPKICLVGHNQENGRLKKKIGIQKSDSKNIHRRATTHKKFWVRKSDSKNIPRSSQSK